MGLTDNAGAPPVTRPFLIGAFFLDGPRYRVWDQTRRLPGKLCDRFAPKTPLRLSAILGVLL